MSTATTQGMKKRKGFLARLLSSQGAACITEVGEGGFGKVYRVDIVDGTGEKAGDPPRYPTPAETAAGKKRTFAIKKVDLRTSSQSVKEATFKEVKKLKAFEGELNFVRLEDDISPEESHVDCFCFAMEYCSLGSLENNIRQGTFRHNEPQCRRLFEQLLTGLEKMFSRKYLHRDLKPGNILLSGTSLETATLKIADFGLAKETADRTQEGIRHHISKSAGSSTPSISPGKLTNNNGRSNADPPHQDAALGPNCPRQRQLCPSQFLMSNVGTSWYFAPERWKSCQDGQAKFGFRAELYAAGMILFEMITGRHFHWLMSWEGFHQRLMEYVPWPDARHLLSLLLAQEPADRCSVQQALAHPWVKGQPDASPGTLPPLASSLSTPIIVANAVSCRKCGPVGNRAELLDQIPVDEGDRGVWDTQLKPRFMNLIPLVADPNPPVFPNLSQFIWHHVHGHEAGNQNEETQEDLDPTRRLEVLQLLLMIKSEDLATDEDRQILPNIIKDSDERLTLVHFPSHLKLALSVCVDITSWAWEQQQGGNVEAVEAELNIRSIKWRDDCWRLDGGAPSVKDLRIFIRKVVDPHQSVENVYPDEYEHRLVFWIVQVTCKQHGANTHQEVLDRLLDIQQRLWENRL